MHDNGLKYLRNRKVVTLDELALHLDRSQRTIQRRLAGWQVINSYNGNGKFYTLESTPKFDANGLWQYKGAFFSRFGNLTATFVQLVENSQAGLTASEAGNLIGLRPSSFLWHLRNNPALKREKRRGLFVYFSSIPSRYNEQERGRDSMPKSGRLPTASEAISILVERIKHPDLDTDELSRRLKNQKIFVSAESIHNLFIHHDLIVKKTLHST
jgi:hypothetical protein